MTEPIAPKNLKARGRRFWDETTGSYDLQAGELLLLAEACRAADRCEALSSKSDPHSITEHRMQQIVLSRLLGQLNLPDLTPATSARGKAANAQRWKGHVVRGVE